MVLIKTSPVASLTDFETYKSILVFNGYHNFPKLVTPRKNAHLPGFAVKCIKPKKDLVFVTHLSNYHLAKVRVSYLGIKLAAIY